jgi:hypothetical protein
LFSDWCSDFGCSDDSIKAKAIYEQCIEQGMLMKAWLGSEKFEEFMGCEE